MPSFTATPPLTLAERVARRCGHQTAAGTPCRLLAPAPGEPCKMHSGAMPTCSVTTAHGWPCRVRVREAGTVCAWHSPHALAMRETYRTLPPPPRRHTVSPTKAVRDARKAVTTALARLDKALDALTGNPFRGAS